MRTTLDGDLQRFAQAQTQDVIAALQRYHVSDGAALVVDNRTGDVLAYVGSPDYFSVEALGSNDGVQALRQPGSSLKPFAYELALERRTIESTTILADVPASYAIPGGKLYQPADYSGRFSGPVRVRYALANSLNAPAVQVLSRLGVGAFLERLHALGFAHLTHPASYYGLGLDARERRGESLGARAGVRDDGARRRLRAAASRRPRRRGAPSVGDAATGSSSPTCSPTRTRARSRSAWARCCRCRFPPPSRPERRRTFATRGPSASRATYTVGVWVGNFDGSAMRGVSGVTGAGPLWNRIMLHLYERRDEPPPFAPPRGFVRAPICATTGHAPESRAVRRSWRSGCGPRISPR